MAVYSTTKPLWVTTVPYVTSVLTPHKSIITEGWIEEGVKQFNDTVGELIWRPRTPSDSAYVVLQSESQSAHSPIGKQNDAGSQVVYCKKSERQKDSVTKLPVKDFYEYRGMHHEMCHALGLGHENFNTGWQWWKIFGEVLKVSANETFYQTAEKRFAEKGTYRDLGNFDPLSTMRYGDTSFLDGLDKAALEKAAKRENLDYPPKAFVSNERLSKLDVQAIKAVVRPMK